MTPVTDGVPVNTSLANTVMVTGVSSSVVAVSATADVTVTVTTPVSVSPAEMAV